MNKQSIIKATGLLLLTIAFTAMTLTFTGCSQQKSKDSMEMGSSRWIKLDDKATAEAKPEDLPTINPETFLATGRLMESQGKLFIPLDIRQDQSAWFWNLVKPWLAI